MSQVFSADAQANILTPVLPHAVSTEVIKTNPLTPPFETCKAKVHASCTIFPDATTTNILLNLVRNPDSENVVIASYLLQFGAGAGEVLGVVDGVDAVPDNRAVVYALVVEPQNGGDTGSIADGSYIDAMLLSG